MFNLWMRKIEVNILDKQFAYPEFFIIFRIKKDDRDDPTISEVEIYNVDNSTLYAIEGARHRSVTVKAGYGDDIGLILNGKIMDVYSEWDGPDKIMSLVVKEGEYQFNDAKYSKTYEKNTKADYIIRDLSAVLGTSIGKLDIKNNRIYRNGKTVSGSAKDSLDKVIKETNSIHKIKDDTLYVGYIKSDTNLGFKLNKDTGLLTNPRLIKEEIDDNEYLTYEMETLLIHQYKVDMGVEIDSETLIGKYRIESFEHTEDFTSVLRVVPLDQPRKPDQVVDEGINEGSGTDYDPNLDGNYSGNSNAEKMWNFIISKGGSKQFAAGIMGNLQQESSLNPNARGARKGRGIVQWQNDSERFFRLVREAEKVGKKWNDLEPQLDHMWWEIFNDSYSVGLLQRREGLTPSQFIKMTNINEVTRIYCEVYERPGIPMMDKRKRYAQGFYNRFS